jgi:hypothetical protein
MSVRRRIRGLRLFLASLVQQGRPLGDYFGAPCREAPKVDRLTGRHAVNDRGVYTFAAWAPE